MYRVMRPAKICNTIVNYTRIGRVFRNMEAAKRLCKMHASSYVINDSNHILFDSKGRDFLKLYGASK